MTADAPWRRVMYACWQQRRNLGSMGFWYGSAGASMLLLVGLALLPGMPSSLVAWVAVGLLGLFAFGAWMSIVASVMLQNEPHAACLVPGHVRTLRHVLVGAGAVITATAGLIDAAHGHPLPAMAATVSTLLVSGSIVRWPLLGLVVWIVPATNSLWLKSGAFVTGVEAVSAAWQARPGLVAAGVAALLLAAVAVLPRTLLQAGGVHHRRRYLQRTRRRTRLETGSADPTGGVGVGVGGDVGAGRFAEGLKNLSTALYRRVLSRACAQHGGDVLGRSLVGLGPRFHWSGLLGTVLTRGVWIALLLGVALRVAWSGSGLPQGPLATGGWVTVGVSIFALAAGLSVRGALYGTRHEQALLMLLPGMPRGTALNRRLAWRLFGQFAVIWGLGVLSSAALLPLHGRELGGAVTFAFVCLPFGALLWRDWSTLRSGASFVSAGAVLAAALGAIVTVVVVSQGWADGAGRAPWPFASIGVVVTAALLAWRWRVVVRSPSALPVGRNAY